jgi:tRNA (cytidine/uridine-2'-O-)-methyltransferase
MQAWQMHLVVYSLPMQPFNIVLIEPEIPPNTGNIARLCAATGTCLHLVGKLGFSTEDRYLKRAGLDYWEFVDIHYWKDLDELKAAAPEGRFFYLSTKVTRTYLDVHFVPGDFIVFGKETKGLPEALLQANPETSITIPMPSEKVRSLNLSTSAGIVLYEALRQVGVLS